ncbi:MAG TPA: hypothetical protein VK203_14680 [Nostocaceae cyanobacterium]|nr:hypothetical protein [Nostocaceae cyanobacterium]
MDSNTIGYSNFLSAVTGVSIYLPNNWQKQDLEDGADEFVDFYFLPSGQEYDPQIMLKLFKLPGDELNANNYQELAVALLEEQCKNDTINALELLEQKIIEIDNYPARIDVFNYVDAELEIPITQYQVCIQQNYGVCGLLAMVQTEYLEQYLPIFETAAKSIRFPM